MPRAMHRNNPKCYPLEERAKVYSAKYIKEFGCTTQAERDHCHTLAALRVELDRIEGESKGKPLPASHRKAMKDYQRICLPLMKKAKPKAIPQTQPVEPTPAPESDFWGAAVG